MLLLKITLVPFFLLVLSLAQRLWGSSIAGWLGGLPVVAGPILFLLTLQQGEAFGAQASTISLAAIFASEMFNLTYARSSRMWSWKLSLLFSLLSWIFAATILALLAPTLPYAMLLAGLSVVTTPQLLPANSTIQSMAYPQGGDDLKSKIIIGTFLTFIITGISPFVGADWSGILAVFPLLGLVMCVSTHQRYGSDQVILMVRGMVFGRYSFAAFCIYLSFTLTHQTPYIAFTLACAISIVVQATTRFLMSKERFIKT